MPIETRYTESGHPYEVLSLDSAPGTSNTNGDSTTEPTLQQRELALLREIEAKQHLYHNGPAPVQYVQRNPDGTVQYEIKDTDKENYPIKKQCTRCGEWYPKTLTYFYKRAKSKDGMHIYCKACQLAVQRNSRNGRVTDTHFWTYTADLRRPEAVLVDEFQRELRKYQAVHTDAFAEPVAPEPEAVVPVRAPLPDDMLQGLMPDKK
jgi:hypothetical protein